ncbi:Os11g0538400 [Anaeromyxobacter sp. Fw109-5]|nr:Os11g0538400 [Anaeromyxobacter sp. Fw109-5]
MMRPRAPSRIAAGPLTTWSGSRADGAAGRSTSQRPGTHAGPRARGDDRCDPRRLDGAPWLGAPSLARLTSMSARCFAQCRLPDDDHRQPAAVNSADVRDAQRSRPRTHERDAGAPSRDSASEKDRVVRRAGLRGPVRRWLLHRVHSRPGDPRRPRRTGPMPRVPRRPDRRRRGERGAAGYRDRDARLLGDAGPGAQREGVRFLLRQRDRRRASPLRRGRRRDGELRLRPRRPMPENPRVAARVPRG